jgi:hypothetical protein
MLSSKTNIMTPTQAKLATLLGPNGQPIASGKPASEAFPTLRDQLLAAGFEPAAIPAVAELGTDTVMPNGTVLSTEPSGETVVIPVDKAADHLALGETYGVPQVSKAQAQAARAAFLVDKKAGAKPAEPAKPSARILPNKSAPRTGAQTVGLKLGSSSPAKVPSKTPPKTETKPDKPANKSERPKTEMLDIDPATRDCLSTLAEHYTKLPTLRDQSFALSLVGQGERGKMSAKQMAWVETLVSRLNGEPPVTAMPFCSAADFAQIVTYLQTLSAKMRFPHIACKAYRLTLAGPKSQYIGTLNIQALGKTEGERREWFGRIHANGSFEPRGDLDQATARRVVSEVRGVLYAQAA